MDNTIVMVMQTCQTFGEKMKTHGLTEFEVLMYEQCCRMVEMYGKVQVKIAEAHLMATERELDSCRQKHAEWEKKRDERDNGGNPKAKDGDGGVDPECGGAPVPMG